MKPAVFEYLTARSTAEAIDLLQRYDGEARLLAGGQSLVPLLNMRIMRPSAVVDISRIPDLNQISADGDTVTMGGLVRHSELEFSPTVHERLPLLAQAVRHVGDRQVRNRGTLAGSLAHGDPAGELPVAATALGATVTVAGPAGTRHVPVADFYAGPYTTVLASDEMITEVTFPAVPGTHGAFAEYARRHGDFAVVMVAAAAVPGPDGTWSSVQLALGGVSDRPLPARAASGLLAGSRLTPADMAAAAAACVAVADPASDVRASAEYRRHLLPIFVERVLTELRDRRAGGAQ